MQVTETNIVDQFQRVINKVLFLKRKDLFEFEGIRFYPSEVHLMMVLDEQCSTNATKIGEQLGITKGAVSQTLSRLEKKGVLHKEKDPQHKNELTLTFTPLGVRALKHYRRRTSAADSKQRQYLSNFTNKEKTAIHGFLCHCEEVLDELS